MVVVKTTIVWMISSRRRDDAFSLEEQVRGVFSTQALLKRFPIAIYHGLDDQDSYAGAAHGALFMFSGTKGMGG